MPSRHWSLVGAVAILLGSQSLSYAADKIGSASAVANKVQGVMDGKTEDVVTGSEVYANQLIRTSAASVADLKFLDSMTLNLGPVSEIVLDKFVYDPASPSNTVVIKVTQGAFKFISGAQGNKSYQIITPFGTMGIRG
jgi:hypothetical protein